MGLILASCRFYCNEADTSAVDRDIINKRQLLADNTDIICNPNYIASTRIQQVATEALQIKKKGIWRRLRIKELMGVPVLPEASRINMLGHVSFAIANRFAATFGLNARCFQKLFEMHSASGPQAHGNNQAGILNPTAFWQFNQNKSVLCFLILPE